MAEARTVCRATVEHSHTKNPCTKRHRLPRRGVAFRARVDVFNDDSFPMSAVVFAFCLILPGYTEERAVDKALEIHAHGVGTVWSGAHDACGVYSKELRDQGLDARLVTG